MATCGYSCPLCEGSGYDEEGNSCSWCDPTTNTTTQKELEKESWIQRVHEGPCCSDFEKKEEAD